MLRLAIAMALAAPAAVAARPALAQAETDAELVTLVKDFIAAERAFDQKRIAALITPDYAEISPIGDLDLHDRFLGFYDADKKIAVPEITIGEMLVRRYGDAASIMTMLSIPVTGPDGQKRTVSVRAGYMAVRSGGTWKLASAQGTPERPKTPPAPPSPPAPPKP